MLIVIAITVWEYRVHFAALITVVFGIVGMFMKSSKKSPAFSFDYDKKLAEEELKDAEDTYESIICSNMISVLEEAMEHNYSIVPPTTSNIHPPADSSANLIDEGSHVSYVVYVQTKDKFDKEKFKTTLTNIITQKRKANELINITNGRVPDYKGIGRSKLQIDSITSAKDGGLLIKCALASTNYFNYKQYQKKRIEQHNVLHDENL